MHTQLRFKSCCGDAPLEEAPSVSHCSFSHHIFPFCEFLHIHPINSIYPIFVYCIVLYFTRNSLFPRDVGTVVNKFSPMTTPRNHNAAILNTTTVKLHISGETQKNGFWGQHTLRIRITRHFRIIRSREPKLLKRSRSVAVR